MSTEDMDYAFLVDPKAEAEGVVRLELPNGVPVDTAADALARLMDADDQVELVALVVGGELVGATSRSYTRIVLAMRYVRGAGDEVRAGRQGESTRYSLIEFGCPECESKAYTAFYDERFTPSCEQIGHGPMELR